MAAGGRRTFAALWSEAGLSQQEISQQESSSMGDSSGAKSTGTSSSTGYGKTYVVDMPYIRVKHE